MVHAGDTATAARTWDAAAMLDVLPECVNRYRVHDLVITYCNRTWADHYGTTAAAAIGRPLTEFLSADEQIGLHDQLARLGPDSPSLSDPEARAIPHTGRWLQWVDQYLVGPDGPEILSIGRDVTERHIAELRLAESEARFRELADNSSDIVWRFMIEPVPHFDYVSPTVERIVGFPPEYFLADVGRFLGRVGAEARANLRAAIGRHQPWRDLDVDVRHADGSVVICETRAIVIPGGIQGVSRDVTEVRALQARLAELALRDPLTGLANRRLLDELLDAELARTQRSQARLAVAYLDIDGLKQVNDEHGHDTGDEVLRIVARRLTEVLGGADIVARVGGDEFVVVFEPDDPVHADLVDRLDAALDRPVVVAAAAHDGRDVVVHCPASIGTSDTRTVGHDPVRLLAAADDAMYQVKRARRSRAGER